MKVFDSIKLIALLSALTLVLSACADGGGDRASGVQPGPDEPNGPVDPPPPIVTPPAPDADINVDDISADDNLSAAVTALSFNSPLSLSFSVTANEIRKVVGITSANLRLSLARLNANPDDSAGESWGAYILGEEDPVCRNQADIDNSINQCSSFSTETDPGLIPDSARKIQDTAAIGKIVAQQAGTENNGELIDNEDGSFTYTFSADIGDPATRNEVHRACIQFSFNSSLENLCVDFIPAGIIDPAIGDKASSLDSAFYDNYSSRQIAVEQTCNSCHDKLAIHGGGRTQMDYCVTCHNPDTIDANSSNNLDLKVLVHKLHNGRNLPSVVVDGGSYKIYGYRNSEHDYSTLSYPQKVINCSRCHAGQEDVDFAVAQGLPMPKATITRDGHDWVSNPTLTGCTSCHEKLVSDNLKLDGTVPTTDHTGYLETTNCAGCHRDRGAQEPGRLQANEAHRDLANEAGRALSIVIESISNTAAGQTPLVTFSIQDASGNKLNLKDPDVMCSDARYDLRMPYDAANEFVARINGSGDPASLGDAGANSFTMDTDTNVVPDSVDTIAAMIDWNYLSDCADSSSEKIRLDAVIAYAASSAAAASERREVVAVEQCNDCHDRFLETSQKHSGTRSVNSPLACVACHSPEFATSDRTREMAIMTHAIHASGIRENPHGSYDEDLLQYPGDLARCDSCHVDDSQLLPLPLVRQPVRTTSTPTYSSPLAATCSSCHDDSLARAHMESAGGAVFDSDFDSAAVTETCDVCHGRGKDADVANVHNK